MTVDWRIPHSPDVEAEVIAWLIHWPADRRKVTDVLDATDFYVPAHRTLFELLAGSSVTLSAADLAARGGLSIDLVKPLVALGMNLPVSVRSQVETVADLSERRSMLGLAEDLRHAARDSAADPAAILEAARVARPPSVSVEDIATFLGTHDPEPDWLIPDVLERGDRVVIVGAEGRGKTTLQRQIAVMGTAGFHPFRRLPITPLRVLIVDLESGPAMVRRKLRGLWIRAKQENPQIDPRNLRVVVRPEGVDLTSRSGRSWLSGILATTKPDLVCLGPIYKTYLGDMNEETVARQVATLIDDWRAEHGSAWILETHAPHGEGGARRAMRPVGSSLWLRWPELGVGLRDDSENADRVRVSWFRYPRDERPGWPVAFRRGGEWPWTAEYAAAVA